MPTLDQAITTIMFEDRATGHPRNNDFWDAVRLCAFAAKRIHNARVDGTLASTNPLEGETEE